jgi:hypothetical protein
VVSGGARRLDWHVLLPVQREAASGHWLLPGADPDVLRLVVELQLAASSSSVPDVGRPADVVGLLHPAHSSLEDATRSLAPGGVLYWEVDRRSVRRIAMTPGRARRRLRDAGLVASAVYLVGNGWRRPDRFLPVDSDGPLRWYLANRLPGFLGRWLGEGRLAARIAALLAPRFVVVATHAGTVASAARTPAVVRHPGVPGAIRTSSVPPIFVSGGQEPWARLVLLAFSEDDSEPSVVLKAGRLAAYDEATEHEHEVLSSVRAQLDEATRATVPEVISLVALGRRPVSVQSAVRGVSALARMHGRRTDAARAWSDLNLAADWLLSLQLQTERSRVAPGVPGWAAHVDEPLERFVDAFGRAPEVERLFGALRDHTATAAAALPIVLCHRDVGPWNVLVDGEAVRVIDWEVARDGPALTDLVYASLHWAFEARGLANEADRRRELRRLYTGAMDDGAAASAMRTTIRRSVEALRIDPRLIPPLVVLTMVGQALDRFDRLARGGRADQRPWLDNRYAGYVAEIASFDDAWIREPTRLLGRS